MGLLLMKFMYCRIVSALILYGIRLSPPQGMYFMRSLMNIGAMSFSSLKTSDVLEVKAAEAWAPGIVTTDVGGINEKSLISCFFRAKIRREMCGGKDNTKLNVSHIVVNSP